MKRIALSIIVVLALVCTGSSFAGDDAAKYQVDITIRYNAVSPEEAAKIARKIMAEHTGACKTEVKQTLVKDILTSTSVMYFDGNGDLVISD